MTLPSGYLELDYITTSGSQYINTGFTSNANMSAEFKFEQLNQWKSESLLFGSAWDANAVLMHLHNGTSAYLYWGSTAVTGTVALNTPTIVTVSKNKYVINGTTYTTSGTPSNWGVMMFGGIDSYYTAQVRLYYLKIWNSGTLVRNMIPCLRISDWRTGMYDQVNNVMYVNASSSGNFLAGPVKGITQSQVEYHNYINADGNAWLDTGVCADDIGKMSCKFRMNYYPQDGTYMAIFGAQAPSSPYKTLIVRWYSNYMYASVNYVNTISLQYPKIYESYTFDMDVSSSGVYSSSLGGTSSSTSTTAGLVKANLFMFASNNCTSIVNPCHGRIYYMKLYNKSKTLIRDFVPAEISYLGIPGFWDEVNKQFYISGGTSTLSADDRPPRCNFGTIKYIGCNGTSANYINTSRNPSAQRWNASSITVSFWAYMSSWPSFGRTVSCTESGGWNYELSGNYISFPCYISGSYRRVALTTSTSSMSGWHFICATYDGLALRIYYDGSLQATTSLFSSVTNISYNGSTNIFVACEASGSSPASPYFNGSISNLRVITSCLTAQEIQQLYNAGYNNKIIINFNGKYNESTMFNFVPACRKSDNTPGLFDLAQGVFYPSNGSSKFNGTVLIETSAEHGTIESIGDIDVGTNVSIENYTQIGYASLGLYDENNDFITRDNPYKFTAVENISLNLKSIQAESCIIL